MRTVRLSRLTWLLAALLPAWAPAAEHAAATPARPPAEAAGEEPAAHPDKGAASAPADPITQLRQRLAERLTTGKAVAGAGSGEVRVVSKAAPAHKAEAARAPAAAHGPAATAHGAGEAAVHWADSGATGPQAWGGIKPEFALCAGGQRQSPIDIRGGLAVDLEPVRFDYQASRFAVVDNGHTVQVNLAPGNSIDVGGRRFELLQFHFHRPSEERIDGRQFELSLHLVHKDDQGRLAVVALLFEKGPPQPVVQKVWNNLPLERNEESPARTPLELAELLPADRRYFTYMGSLTTPPCSEGVQWIVMRQAVTLSPEQIEIFARIYPMNARPVQAASGRRIMQSN
jgi:carbonic anhydrase